MPHPADGPAAGAVQPAAVREGPGRSVTASRRVLARRGGGLLTLGAVWLATRLWLMLTVTGVLATPGQPVTPDVSYIYHGWFRPLSHGVFPPHDPTWQYPPGAALVMLAPGYGPFGYADDFFVLTLVADLAVTLALLTAAWRHLPAEGRGRRGTPGAVWLWTAGVPLLGPTVYARYDLIVAAVAIAGLLVAWRSPRLAGGLLAFGALLKVWPALALVGTPRGRRTREAWTTAVVVAVVFVVFAVLGMPGALSFLTQQKDRGIEVESLGGSVFEVARHLGWGGSISYHYGSMEFLGSGVPLVARLSLALTVLAALWVLLWRLRARRWTPATQADAALTTVLLFVTTSRVISPQYLVWVIGLLAVCLLFRETSQRALVWPVLAATALTFLDFPAFFGSVLAGNAWGTAIILARNALLLLACLRSAVLLWRATA